MRISDWSSDVCSSDLLPRQGAPQSGQGSRGPRSRAPREDQHLSPQKAKHPIMKLTIERAALLKSLTHVQSVVERRNTIPILSNVLIEADGEALDRNSTRLNSSH